MTQFCGFVLVLDGCPYAFGTANLPALAWPSGEEPTGAQLLQDTLAWPRFSWSERLHPNDGDLEYSAPSVFLHDVPGNVTAAAGLAGVGFTMSYLLTRRVSSLLRTKLGADIKSTSTTVTLASGAGFPSSSFVLWVGREAILCSSRSGATCTISQRGYYGTRTEDHLIDAALNVAPDVFGEFPGAARRRVRFFAVENGGSARLLFTAYCNRTPRVSGAMLELPLRSAWETERDSLLAPVATATQLRGFDGWALSFELRNASARLGSYLAPLSGHPVYNTLADLCMEQLAALAAQKSGEASTTAVPNVGPTADGFRASISVDGPADAVSFTLRARLVGHSDVASQPATSDASGHHRYAEVVLSPAPTALVLASARYPYKFPLSTALGLPSGSGAWGQSEPLTGYGTQYAFVTPVLSAKLDDERTVDLVAPNAGAGTPLNLNDTDLPIGGVTFLATAHTRRGMVQTPWDTVEVLEEALTFRLNYAVIASHWALAFAAMLNDTRFLRPSADVRNWDFSTLSSIFAASGSRATDDVRWFLDDTRKVGDFLGSIAPLNGCCVGVRGGKLCLVPIRWALANEPASVSFANSEEANGAPTDWIVNEDGLVTAVHLKGEQTDLLVRDANAVEAYGDGRTVDLDVTGLVDEGAILANPILAGQNVLSRVLGLWSEPTYFLETERPFGLYWNVYLGDFVEADSWLAPDGEGGRGLALQPAMVVGREVNLERATIRFRLLLTDIGVGYSPCVRVASASGATVTVATAYMNGSDYARSGDADYPYAATSPLDGGTAHFKVGHRVQLLQRDSASPTTQTAAVTAVNPAAKTITLDASVSAGLLAVLGAGGIVDLRFTNYGDSITADQKLWAWQASSTGVISPSADPADPWAP